MSVSYFVRYEGAAENRDEFLRYYRENHAPILARFPGIRNVILHTPIDWQDRFPVRPDRFLLLAQMVFDNREDLKRALESDARGAARLDFSRFPRFDGVVYHQAALMEQL